MSDNVTIIEARPRGLGAAFRAMWQYRRFYPLLMREIAIRKFRNTLLGWWWLVLRPLVPTIIAIVTFSFIVKIDTGTLPYALFYLGGFLTWTLVSSTVSFMPRTLLWMSGLMKKTYFPRLLVPAAAIGPPLIEFVVVLVLFALALVLFGILDGIFYLELSWGTLVIVPCLLLALTLGWAVGTILSVIALFVRDVVFTTGYIVQFAMFVTPVLYPVEQVPEGIQWAMYVFNPMTAIVETGRWGLFGSGTFEPIWFGVSVVQIGLLCVASLVFFLRAENQFADML